VNYWIAHTANQRSFLATDNDVVPENLSAAEIRAEIIAQFQAAFPEYRWLKVIPAPDKRPRRRQSFRNEPNATLIGTATEPASTPSTDRR
jgi:hypothetical protein